MSDTFVSLIRTGVALAVGAVAAWLIARGVEIDTATQDQLVYSLGALATAVYYGVARWLENRWPWTGVLLGVPKAPSYEKAGAE